MTKRYSLPPLRYKAKIVASFSAAPLLIALFIIVDYGLDPLLSSLMLLCIVAANIALLRPYFRDINILTLYVKRLVLNRSASLPALQKGNVTYDLSLSIKQLHDNLGQQKIQLQSALAESQILLDVLPDLLLMLGDDYTVIRANNAAITYFGKHIIKRHVNEIIPETDLLGALKQTTKTGNQEFLRLTLTNQQVTRHYRVHTRKFPVESTEHISTLLIFQDVTESRKTRQMMKDFVANASHEIRTPLTSIAGFIETLQGLEPDEEDTRQHFLGIMAKQSDNMKDLVNNLLSLSKAELREINSPTEQVQIIDIIETSVNQMEWMAKQKNMHITTEHEDSLAMICGDHSELTQVFTNLLTNAVRYGFDNSVITVHSYHETLDSPEQPEVQASYVRVDVTNHGEGIAEAVLSRITERFYRIDKVRSRQLGGSGLGLAIVKHILNRHHANLEVKSTPNETTTFTIHFPAIDDTTQLDQKA